MAKNARWIDEYWLLLMQLYLQKPVGVKPMYSRKMVDLSLDLLGLIYRANMSVADRQQTLTNLLIDYRQLQMLLRVCYRQKALSSGRYAEMINLLDTIGRQATGWKNKTIKNN